MCHTTKSAVQKPDTFLLACWPQAPNAKHSKRTRENGVTRMEQPAWNSNSGWPDFTFNLCTPDFTNIAMMLFFQTSCLITKSKRNVKAKEGKSTTVEVSRLDLGFLRGRKKNGSPNWYKDLCETREQWGRNRFRESGYSHISVCFFGCNTIMISGKCVVLWQPKNHQLLAFKNSSSYLIKYIQVRLFFVFFAVVIISSCITLFCFVVLLCFCRTRQFSRNYPVRNEIFDSFVKLSKWVKNGQSWSKMDNRFPHLLWIIYHIFIMVHCC